MSLIVIEAGKTERGYWTDLWRYRELFFFLSWRDILVRYKQTVIGVLWAVIRPILTMIALTFVFGKLAGVHSDGLPFAVMVLAGTLPWQFFASSMTEASNSLITNANMLSKIYFPRLIIPASSVIVSFMDFLVSLAIMAVLMAWYRVLPGWQLLTLPLFTLLGLFASVGISLWLAALNVKYRDFRYVLPFVVQFGVFFTPVGFPSEVVRQKYGETASHLFSLNPMVGVINGFRWAIGGRVGVPMDWSSVLISVLVVAVITVSGLRYFRATEETFADII
ncbi:MAG TPA: ABC transporter permease [Candidatus Methylacidiphilales bacterium]|jgi:lipopolysaccharide transport system permease protein|nr:ABC transporter permease [Candidatus Methylacidiphilales bacterium]